MTARRPPGERRGVDRALRHGDVGDVAGTVDVGSNALRPRRIRRPDDGAFKPLRGLFRRTRVPAARVTPLHLGWPPTRGHPALVGLGVLERQLVGGLPVPLHFADRADHRLRQPLRGVRDVRDARDVRTRSTSTTTARQLVVDHRSVVDGSKNDVEPVLVSTCFGRSLTVAFRHAPPRRSRT